MRHLLLLGNQNHSQCLPDAPHHDEEFFHSLFEAFDRTLLCDEGDEEYDVAEADDNCIEYVPLSDLTSLWVSEVSLTSNELDSAAEVNSDHNVEQQLQEDKHRAVRNFEAIEDCDNDQDEGQNKE